MSQFTNERQLFSYTGLTPSEHSSGQSTRKGHITKQGKRAIVAVARKFIGRIRAAFRKGELYPIDSPDALATAS